jgi:starvation-inducible outer membrane lipoprotein
VIQDAAPDLEHDWDLGEVRLKSGSGRPGVQLMSADGRVIKMFDGFASPAALGRALRGALGAPSPYDAAVLRN